MLVSSNLLIDHSCHLETAIIVNICGQISQGFDLAINIENGLIVTVKPLIIAAA